MGHYRKKPVVIEAVQWTGDNIAEIKDLCDTYVEYDVLVNELVIRTLEGDMRASLNDYIIKGVQGECYPCKPDIFHATYEEVTNGDITRQKIIDGTISATEMRDKSK